VVVFSVRTLVLPVMLKKSADLIRDSQGILFA
jgi:hypothetical protein